VITAIVIPVNPNQPIRQQQLYKHDLDAHRQLVGGNLEVLNLDRPPASLYFNDEGKLLEFPVNARATVLLWAHNSTFRGHDVIAGPAFIVGPPDHDADDTTVPDDLVHLLFHTKRYRVQMWTSSEPRWDSDNQVFTDWLKAYRYALQLAEMWSVIEEVRVVPELDDELREQWYKLGIANPWIKTADDPPFTRNSFVGCYSVDELAEWISGTVWAIGTAFYYRDLCFIQQVEGGDEWLTIRHGIAFESMTLNPSIEDGSFASLVRRLLTASTEQCQRLEY
jgi:hypothetical protein